MPNSFVDDLTNYVGALQKDDRPLFPLPLTWAILSNGDAEYQDNIVLFGFEPGRRQPSLVVKTPRLLENGSVLQVEYDRLVELWGLLGAKAVSRLPRPVALAKLNGQNALVLSYVRGESLVRASKRSMWGDTRQVVKLFTTAARAYRELIDLTAVPLAAGEQINSDFSQRVEKFRQEYGPNAIENQVLDNLLAEFQVCEKEATHKVLVQGDFWHGNIIRENEPGQLLFIDWQYARWATNVSLDVYLFLLAAALASAPHEPLEERAAQTVRQIKGWRNEVIPAYLAAFGAPAGFTLLPLKTGMLATCVELAVRVGMDFGFTHSDDITWRMIFGELIHWPEENQ